MISFAVYRATCLPTGKAYIGCTRQGLTTRRAEHHRAAREGKVSRFYTALRKYGNGAFTWEVLTTYDTQEAMFKGEREMIAKYHSVTRGLNSTSGGHEGQMTALDQYKIGLHRHSTARVSGGPACSRSHR